ncbi:hypothetical protein D3C76_688400 [compost metagenome]
MHDPVVILVLMEMKTVEFFFLHHQLPADTVATGDLEGFTGAQGQDLVARRVLGQLQVPAIAVATVLPVERAVRQRQGKTRTA